MLNVNHPPQSPPSTGLMAASTPGHSFDLKNPWVLPSFVTKSTILVDESFRNLFLFGKIFCCWIFWGTFLLVGEGNCCWWICLINLEDFLTFSTSLCTVEYLQVPESNGEFTPENGWERKTMLSFWGKRPIFRCEPLVSGRVFLSISSIRDTS